MSFTLHPQLEKDTAHVADLPLCRVLLMNNQNFPWLILVPKQDGLREITDLSESDYSTCMQEVRMVMQRMAAHTNADKMNVAALGNMVPQLHIHIIARFATDIAWPKPVWSVEKPIPYEPQALVKEAQNWAQHLQVAA